MPEVYNAGNTGMDKLILRSQVGIVYIVWIASNGF